jgi:hypothetical protein
LKVSLKLFNCSDAVCHRSKNFSRRKFNGDPRRSRPFGETVTRAPFPERRARSKLEALPREKSPAEASVALLSGFDQQQFASSLKKKGLTRSV